MFGLIRRYQKYDPAAKSFLEVALLYPGPKAIGLYRVAHRLHRLGVPFVPRLLSETGRFLTGIEIHPGATIGQGLIIDHGMGVVIGETAELGDDVIIYQGVTLGGTHLERRKRHPTIGDRVVIGTGAKVLGAITIGEGSRIGANSVILEDVPPNSTIVGVVSKRISRGIRPGEELDHDRAKEPNS